MDIVLVHMYMKLHFLFFCSADSYNIKSEKNLKTICNNKKRC